MFTARSRLHSISSASLAARAPASMIVPRRHSIRNSSVKITLSVIQLAEAPPRLVGCSNQNCALSSRQESQVTPPHKKAFISLLTEVPLIAESESLIVRRDAGQSWPNSPHVASSELIASLLRTAIDLSLREAGGLSLITELLQLILHAWLLPFWCCEL
ncbi:hypothetical protein BJY01DRAFT_31220 [Aspergillus pseudoustus]|uniref:Uncharacterized protein n=1 Tax=Aspergillus pseudoustus TaxID=1810923 RepID=A0ABR4KQE9_9EURO